MCCSYLRLEMDLIYFDWLHIHLLEPRLWGLYVSWSMACRFSSTYPVVFFNSASATKDIQKALLSGTQLHFWFLHAFFFRDYVQCYMCCIYLFIEGIPCLSLKKLYLINWCYNSYLNSFILSDTKLWII